MSRSRKSRNRKSRSRKSRSRKSRSKPNIPNKVFINYDKIYTSELFKLIYSMPKGGMFHAHFAACVNMYDFIMFLMKNFPELYKNIYYLHDYFEIIKYLDKQKNDNLDEKIISIVKDYLLPINEKAQGNINFIGLTYFDENPKIGWRKLSAITNPLELKNIIIKNTTMSSVSDYTWLGLEKFTNSYWSLIKNSKIFAHYFDYVIECAIKENIKILELKSNIGGFFELKKMEYDLSVPIYEKLWNEQKEKDILRESIKKYRNEIYVSLIYGIPRGFVVDNNIDMLEAVKKRSDFISKRICDKYGKGTADSDIIKGLDLFGEEDISLTNLDLFRTLDYCNMNLYLHSGESTLTNKGERNINLDLAYRLLKQNKTIRVGHGLELIKDKELLENYVDKKIHVELCPLSNYILGYVDSIKNHPGKKFLDKGVRISINGDDHGIYGYQQLI